MAAMLARCNAALGRRQVLVARVHVLGYMDLAQTSIDMIFVVLGRRLRLPWRLGSFRFRFARFPGHRASPHDGPLRLHCCPTVPAPDVPPGTPRFARPAFAPLINRCES